MILMRISVPLNSFSVSGVLFYIFYVFVYIIVYMFCLHIGFHFSNILFWFASLVAVISYALSHWQSFRKSIFGGVGESNAQDLVFDTLQIAILAAVILFAGATIQAVEMLSVHLMNEGSVIDAEFGARLLSVFVLVVFAVLFYLLHRVVRAFRLGWKQRWTPPGTSVGPTSSGRT